jgi:hypothetical protein
MANVALMILAGTELLTKGEIAAAAQKKTKASKKINT